MTKKRLLIILVAASIAFLMSTMYSASGAAVADIQTFKLIAYQVSPNNVYYSGNQDDAERGGVKVKVECNIATDELVCEYDYYTDIETVTYELDKLLLHEPEEGVDSRRYRYIYLTVYRNCDISITATLDKGEDSEGQETFDISVNKIDNKAPRFDNSKYPVPTRVGYNLLWRAHITDDNAASYSAASGLAEIIAFRFDPNQEFDETKPIESLGNIYDIKNKLNYKITEYVGFAVIEFTMDEDGWYLIYMKDQIGNVGYASFAYYTAKPKYLIDNIYGGQQEVNVALYESWLSEGKGKINQGIWDNLRRTLDNFILTFQLQQDMPDKIASYNLLYTAINDYTKAKITYNEVYTNKELVDNIYAVNLDSVAVMLPGDTLELAGIITSYNQSDIDRFAHKDVIDLANVRAPDKIIAISYKLLKNTNSLTPKEPLILHVEFTEGAEVVLVSSTDNNRTFVVREYVRDKTIIQFSTTAPTEEFYFVVRYGKAPPNWLAIGLGVGGGVLFIAIAIVVVLAVLYKRAKKNENLAKIAVDDPVAQETTTNTREKLEKKQK